MLAVGHHLEIQMVEGDRGREVVLQPLAGLMGHPEAGLPDSGRVAVEGGDGAGGEIAGEPALRIGDDPGVVGAGPADQAVDLVVGHQWRDTGRPTQGEGPGGREPEGPGECGLGVGPGGTPKLRSRVISRVSESKIDDGPVVLRRSWGRETVSWTVTPGICTSANPTELVAWVALRIGACPMASTVIRRVE